MKNTIIISGFPGIGKTHYTNLCTHSPEKDAIDKECLDLILEDYKWEKDKHGEKTRLILDEYPDNYIKMIKENIGKYDIIFITHDKKIRSILRGEGYEFVSVVPTSVYTTLQRLHMKNEKPDVINDIIPMWDKLRDEIITNDYKVMITDNDISDIINDLDKEKTMTFITHDITKEKEEAANKRQEHRNYGEEIDFESINRERKYWGIKPFVKNEN